MRDLYIFCSTNVDKGKAISPSIAQQMNNTRLLHYSRPKDNCRDYRGLRPTARVFRACRSEARYSMIINSGAHSTHTNTHHTIENENHISQHIDSSHFDTRIQHTTPPLTSFTSQDHGLAPLHSGGLLLPAASKQH